jgi:dolichol-phosphate mannosyltransferase
MCELEDIQMISIIFPVYNEEENLLTLYKRLKSVTAETHEELEFIFVDDCSTDSTLSILEDLKNIDDRIEIIRFSRNCGSHAAVSAGLNFCSGDNAIILSADLQDPPEIVPRLLNEWRMGYKVVWGVREKREGENLLVRASSRLYYFLMNHLTNVTQPPTGADVFLIDRVVIDAFKQSPEKNTSVYMLIAWLGFTQTYIRYVKEARFAGTSKWNTAKRIKLLLDSLISFSYVPLRFMSLMGVICALLGLFYSIIVFLNALNAIPVQGWSSLMIVVLFLGGIQMTMLGILGEYLWRAYDETRGRLRYVIEKNTIVKGSENYSEKKTHDD